jgi:hypothetical protein
MGAAMSHPDDQYEDLSSTFAAACRQADAEQRRKKPARSNNVVQFLARSTLDVAEYLARLNDPEQMRTWLAKHSAAERAAIFKHLKGEK